MREPSEDMVIRYNTPFHALAGACELANAEALLPVFASSQLEVFPYQVAAARFMLGAAYLKGAVLCDKGSLGKTFEALLVIAQFYYERRDRILIVVPLSLLRQWRKVLKERFSVPYEMPGDTLPNGIVLTTYEWAAAHAGELNGISWDLIVFEEAHWLHKENQESAALQGGNAHRRIQSGLGDSAGARRSMQALFRASNQRHDLSPDGRPHLRTVEDPLRPTPFRSPRRHLAASRPLLAGVQEAVLNHYARKATY